MKFIKNWKMLLGILMIMLSAAFYYLHYVLFRDAHHIFIYLIGDIAFVFVEVLLVSIIIHQLLNEWEKKSHLKKINMVIEVFFSEFGKQLLSFFSLHDKNIKKIQDTIITADECDDINFKKALFNLKSYIADININLIDLNQLSKFLKDKRGFLVNLLQNPNLLEHESFSETLMSIFHITEELAARNLKNLSEEDIKHTKNDLERAYKFLTKQWFYYMDYTKINFPYFYLFAVKTNPFNENSDWLDKWYEKNSA